MIDQTNLKAILLDLDGVLWRGSESLVDIPLLFDRIDSLGLLAFCVTNNSTRLADDYLERFNEYGVFLEPSQIITSAEATAEFIEDKFPRSGSLFVIGEEGLTTSLRNRSFQIIEDDSDSEVLAVVVGLDRSFNYRDIELAVYYVQQGALFVGTNPDLTLPTPLGFAPGAGTIIKAIEVSSSVKPYIIGKPFPALFSLALKRAKCLPEEALMIGDRLETDILGAQQVGVKSALVLSGITNQELGETWDPPPDIIAENALKVLEIIGNNDGKSV